MRPNFAQDAPPTSIEVGGISRTINTDYRIWIDALNLIRSINFRIDSKETLVKTAQAIEDLERLVFGEVIDAPIMDVMESVIKFSRGYEFAPVKSISGENRAQTYSFNYDINEIIVAIMDQHKVDLSYRCEYFHWWEFLLLFHTLSGDHVILNMMSARGYTGKDKDLKKRRDAWALPVELSADEQAEIDAFNAMFDTEEDNDERN